MKQRDAMEILKTGKNVFLTGEPGAGKTRLINEYIGWMNGQGINAAVTASTGIAATWINGTTVHAWSGIGIRSACSDEDIEEILSNKRIYDRIKGTEALIIDEISMLAGSVVDALNRICRAAKSNTIDPFGGMQVVFVGDFFQLPPVRGGEEGDAEYAFLSDAWNQARCAVCYLDEQHRQDDAELLGILRAIRRQRVSEKHRELLRSRKTIGYRTVEPTRLHTRNVDVDRENAEKLEKLPGEARKFEASLSGERRYVDALVKNCMSPEELEIKEGAAVMFTKNNPPDGFMNGTLGTVVAFDQEDGLPVVKKADGESLKVAPMIWETEENARVVASMRQVPLRLAWAITVHKSQGISIDAARINLSTAFAEGQGYVALSRVRSLRGICVEGLNDIALKVSDRVSSANRKFFWQSLLLEKAFADKDRLKKIKAAQKSRVDKKRAKGRE